MHKNSTCSRHGPATKESDRDFCFPELPREPQNPLLPFFTSRTVPSLVLVVRVCAVSTLTKLMATHSFFLPFFKAYSEPGIGLGTKVLLLELVCFSHWMFVSLPFVRRSIHRDYIAVYLWATTVSCCLGIRGLFFMQVIQTASLPLYRCRNWDLEKRRDGSKVTQSLHSRVQYRSSSPYRTYVGLYVHQCVKVWPTESSFPTLIL